MHRKKIIFFLLLHLQRSHSKIVEVKSSPKAQVNEKIFRFLNFCFFFRSRELFRKSYPDSSNEFSHHILIHRKFEPGLKFAFGKKIAYGKTISIMVQISILKTNFNFEKIQLKKFNFEKRLCKKVSF